MGTIIVDVPKPVIVPTPLAMTTTNKIKPDRNLLDLPTFYPYTVSGVKTKMSKKPLIAKINFHFFITP